MYLKNKIFLYNIKSIGSIIKTYKVKLIGLKYHEISRPHCHKSFKIDKSGYTEILKQIYNKEFDKQLNEKLLQREEKKNMEIKIERKEAEKKIFELENKKNNIIKELEFNLKEAETTKRNTENSLKENMK